MSGVTDPMGMMAKAVTRALDPITLDYLEESGADRVEMLVRLIPLSDMEPLRAELSRLRRGGAVSREDVVRHALQVIDTSRKV
jgi:hypothetical protein